jgi:hypothetical protein
LVPNYGLFWILFEELINASGNESKHFTHGVKVTLTIIAVWEVVMNFRRKEERDVMSSLPVTIKW